MVPFLRYPYPGLWKYPQDTVKISAVSPQFYFKYMIFKLFTHYYITFELPNSNVGKTSIIIWLHASLNHLIQRSCHTQVVIIGNICQAFRTISAFRSMIIFFNTKYTRPSYQKRPVCRQKWKIVTCSRSRYLMGLTLHFRIFISCKNIESRLSSSRPIRPNLYGSNYQLKS